MRLSIYIISSIPLWLLIDQADSFGHQSIVGERRASVDQREGRFWVPNGGAFCSPPPQPRRYENSETSPRRIKTVKLTTTAAMYAVPRLEGAGIPRSSLVATVLRGGAAATTVASKSPPPLSVWMGPALFCALSYALYNLFIKKAALHDMDPVLGGVLLQSVAAAVGGLLWLALKLRNGTAATAAATPPTRTAVAWAAAAGLAVGAAELLSFVISGLGVQSMQSVPVVIGGSVFMGTVLGSLWLKEVLTWKGWCGVALISIGVALVGIDPGSGSLH